MSTIWDPHAALWVEEYQAMWEGRTYNRREKVRENTGRIERLTREWGKNNRLGGEYDMTRTEVEAGQGRMEAGQGRMEAGIGG